MSADSQRSQSIRLGRGTADAIDGEDGDLRPRVRVDGAAVVKTDAGIADGENTWTERFAAGRTGQVEVCADRGDDQGRLHDVTAHGHGPEVEAFAGDDGQVLLCDDCVEHHGISGHGGCADFCGLPLIRPGLCRG